jgi:hypothetical protein
MTTTTRTAPAEPINLRKVITMALVAAAIASAANLIVFYLAKIVFGVGFVFAMQPGADPQALAAFQVIVSSTVPAFGAAGLLYGLNRFTRRGLLIFQVIAVVLLLVSFGAPLTLAPDGSIKAALSIMHLVAGTAIIGALTYYSSRA